MSDTAYLRHRYTISDSEFEFSSQWAAGIEPWEAAQCPHRKHIPVRGVADGTAFIKHSRNVLLKRRETNQHILLDRVLRTQRIQMNFRDQETALLTCGQSPLGSCLSIKTWMPRSITLMSGYLKKKSFFSKLRIEVSKNHWLWCYLIVINPSNAQQVLWICEFLLWT